MNTHTQIRNLVKEGLLALLTPIVVDVLPEVFEELIRRATTVSEDTTLPEAIEATQATVRPTSRPLVGEVWKRKSNGTIVTITRVDDDKFSLNKQIKWPTGTLSRQRFPLSEYVDFVKAFDLVQAGEAN